MKSTFRMMCRVNIGPLLITTPMICTKLHFLYKNVEIVVINFNYYARTLHDLHEIINSYYNDINDDFIRITVG